MNDEGKTAKECLTDKCELKEEIRSLRVNADEFQRKTAAGIEDFQKEIRRCVKENDTRQTRERTHLESELRSEIQRGLMATNRKVDGVVSETNTHLMSISSDLGEIKGALGLKAEKKETGQLRSSVMKRIELAKEEARKEVETEIKEIRALQTKTSNKFLYLLITLLSSGLFLILGLYLRSIN